MEKFSHLRTLLVIIDYHRIEGAFSVGGWGGFTWGENALWYYGYIVTDYGMYF